MSTITTVTPSITNNYKEWRELFIKIIKLTITEASYYAYIFDKLSINPNTYMTTIQIDTTINGINSNEYAVVVPSICIQLLLKCTFLYDAFNKKFGINNIFFIRGIQLMSYKKLFETYAQIFDISTTIKISFLAKLDNSIPTPVIQSCYINDFIPLISCESLHIDTILEHSVLTMFINIKDGINYYYSSINEPIERKQKLIPKIINEYCSSVKNDIKLFQLDLTTLINEFDQSLVTDINNITDANNVTNVTDIRLVTDHISYIDSACCICLDKSLSHAVDPCGHLCLCNNSECFSKLSNCPICRSPITKLLKVFIN